MVEGKSGIYAICKDKTMVLRQMSWESNLHDLHCAVPPAELRESMFFLAN
jgi:hypothetical protein